MKRASKSMFIAGALLVASATSALAEAPAGGEEEGTEEGTEEGGTEAKPDANKPADVTAGVYTKANWPLAAIDRPLTAAKGMAEVSPLFALSKVKDQDTGMAINLDGRFGVSDKLEVIAGFDRIILAPSPES